MQKSMIAGALATFLKKQSCSVVLKEVNKAGPLFSTAVALKFSDHYISSFGQGISKGEAVFKALMEATERYVLMTSSVPEFSNFGSILSRKRTHDDLTNLFPLAKNWIGNSSNGVSAHTSLREAKMSAIDELIERHVVLKAHFLNISPGVVESSLIAKEFSLPSISLRFYAWRGPLNRFVVLASGTQGSRRVFGIGCHSSLEKAKSKAFLEISPRLALLEKDLEADLKVMALNKNFLFHWYEKSEEITTLLDSANSFVPVIDGELRKSDFWTGDFDLPPELRKIGISVVKAVSPKIQQLFTGLWEKEKINPEALQVEGSLPNEYHLIG